jgi:tetratricopeptide (TPR) repeat protein
MESCTDEKTGALRIQYELGQLKNAERERFEEHLLVCDFCFRELSESAPWTAALLEKRAEIRENLRRQGLTFESQKALYMRSLPASTGAESKSENRWFRLLRRLKAGPKPVILLPAGAVALLALFLLIFRPSPEPSSPYLSLLQFEPIPYESSVVRGGSDNEAELRFQEGMIRYQKGDYAGAVKVLKTAAASDPENGIYRLFLGVSYFLDRQADPAIQALSAADSLTQFSFQEKTRWYLAQAYLLKSDANRAIPLLRWLVEQNGEYTARAAELLRRIE